MNATQPAAVGWIFRQLTMISRRGLAACESEWLLACTARNLRKLHRHRVEG